MRFYKDNYDCRILKKDTYKLYLDKETTNEELNSQIHNIEDGIIFCFTIFSPKNFHLLQANGFNLISIRCTYKLNLDAYLKQDVIPISNNYKILGKTEAINRLTDKDLKHLSKTMYKTSRYCKDENIVKDKGLAIYVSWIKNSFYKNYADQYFVIFSDSKALGFITIKIKNNKGFIDLLGVIEEYQNQKIATYLLKKAIDYLQNKKIENIFLTTEVENIPANILYQKNCFIIQGVELAYHKHIK